MIRRAGHRRARAAAAAAAYPRWRPEREAVRAAHRVWVAASAVGEPLAFRCISRRSPARRIRTRRMRRVRRLTGSGLARQLASVPALLGAW
jgi:hypothetical protein